MPEPISLQPKYTSCLSVGEDIDLQFIDNVSMEKRMYNKPTVEEIDWVFRSVYGYLLIYPHIVAH